MSIFNIHWGGYNGQPPYRQRSVRTVHLDVPNRGTLDDEWHVFGLLWTPNHDSFYLNDRKMWDTTQRVSRRNESLILSTHAGGDENFQGPAPDNGFGNRNDAEERMVVDWVRWWQEE